MWAGVAAVEVLLYYLLYRSPGLSDLFLAPAVIVLAAGAVQSWRVLGRHARRDRRQGGRRRRRRH